MPPPTTVSGKLVLDSLTLLSKELKFYAEGFKATKKLTGAYKEIESIKTGARAAKNTVTQLSKDTKGIKKLADDGKKLWDNLLKKVPGGATPSGASAAGGSMASLLAIGGVAAITALITKLQGSINESSFASTDKLQTDLTTVNSLTVKIGLEVKQVQEKINSIDREVKGNKDKLFAETGSAVFNATKARETANNALYETRQGRQILEAKISEARKLGNDALYEVRKIAPLLDPIIGKVNEALRTAGNALTRAEQLPKVINGKDGKNGVDGKNGINGKNGVDGRNGTNGRDGKDGTVQMIVLPGTPGKQGERGLPGIPGLPGRNGKDGKDGKDAELDAYTKSLIQQTAKNAAFIPALVARPTPLTSEQTINAAATGVCRTTQPGGCMGKALQNNADDIKSNNNNNTGSVLDAINLGGTGALLENQQTILTRLGDQLPGGIGGKLTRFSQWLHLDRALNILTFAATVHNGVQLSNDIAVTLGTVLSNGLSLIGIKDDTGSSIDIGQLINSTVGNLVKGIVGESNYQQLSNAWTKANRIYQASTNVLNSLMNVNSVITNALEVIGSYTGKIGNALRIWGVVGERAYSWMNPQPSFDNKWIAKLQQLQEGANTVAVVAQIPIDATNAITEFNNSTTELVKAVKQEPDTKSGIDVGEAAKVKEEREASKAVSIPLSFDISDLFDADD